MSATTDLTGPMCRRHPGPPITRAASDRQIVRSGRRCRASAPIAASARARSLSSSGSSHHGAPRSPKATLAAWTRGREPDAIRITSTVRRSDRTSGRHQLVHELFPKRRRNRGIGPPPAPAVDRDPHCVVVHTRVLPTTAGSAPDTCYWADDRQEAKSSLDNATKSRVMSARSVELAMSPTNASARPRRGPLRLVAGIALMPNGTASSNETSATRLIQLPSDTLSAKTEIAEKKRTIAVQEKDQRRDGQFADLLGAGRRCRLRGRWRQRWRGWRGRHDFEWYRIAKFGSFGGEISAL